MSSSLNSPVVVLYVLQRSACLLNSAFLVFSHAIFRAMLLLTYHFSVFV